MQCADDELGRLALPQDSHFKGPDAPGRKPAVETRHGRPEVQPVLVELLKPVTAAAAAALDRQNPTQEIGMAADVLGARVHHDVRAVEKRVLQWRRRERRVHAKVRTSRMGSVCIVLDIQGPPGRIHGRLEMDQVARAELVDGTIERENLGAGRAGVELERAVTSMVSRTDRDPFWVQHVQQGVECGQAGGIGDARLAQDRRQHHFQARQARRGLSRVAVLPDIQHRVRRPLVVRPQAIHSSWVSKGRGDVNWRCYIVDAVEDVVGVHRSCGG